MSDQFSKYQETDRKHKLANTYCITFTSDYWYGCDANCLHDDVIKGKHFPRYSSVTGEFLAPVTRNFDIFFGLPE